MLATLLSAAITCVAALLLGQGVLWVCGRRTWSWLSGPVGLSVAMVLAVPALHVPGRATTCAVVIFLLAAASAVLMVRDPALRPPLAGLAAGIWPLLLALVPFAVAGRFGTLGVSVSNDMTAHLLLADAHIHAALEHEVGPNYPLGPHAVVGAIAGPLPIDTDFAFAGFTIALPTLLGWTALAALRRVGWLGQAVTATLVGIPFLIAAYLGEGAFKEIFLAQVIIAVALLLADRRHVVGPLRWVPMGLLIAGAICTYSYTALLWPALFFAAWLGGLLLAELVRGGAARRRVTAAVRTEVVPIAIGLGVLLVAIISQLPRIKVYLEESGGGTGLAETALGNLVGPLPFWEGFGVWDNPDFRFPARDALEVGVLVGIIVVLVVVAAVWWLRRGDWMVPLALVLCGVIWVYADQTQSPYVAAKALVLFTPFAMLVIVRPLVERASWGPVASWVGPAATVVAAALLWVVIGSSWDALRHSTVGPRDHAEELRSLRGTLGDRPTLFLGNDDFIRWELQGVPVIAPFIGSPGVPTRPEKGWQYGQAFDFDSVGPDVYQGAVWVIAPRDAAGSAPPPQLRLVRTTRDFALYRRVGPVQQRGLLPEGEGPAAILDCRGDRAMRKLSRLDGTAYVRPGGVAVPVPALAAGADRRVSFTLPVAGTWDIVMGYTSTLPLKVDGPGLSTTMPPNLDRPGPRFPVGSVTLSRPGSVTLRLRVPGHRLASTAGPAIPTSLIAVPRERDRPVPLRRACGKNVDYFTLDR